MKLALALVLVALTPSDHARGLQLLAEGKFVEAAEAFRAAIDKRPEDPELHYNLALALWRAGAAHEAEIAAEKAATLSDGRLAPLRDGILGNLAVADATAKLGGEPPDLMGALAAAERARDHFVHGAVAPGAPVELARNLERTLALIAEIEKKIEEQKQQEQKDGKGEDGKDGKEGGPAKDQPKDDQSKDDQPKDKDQPSGDDKQSEQKDKDAGQPPQEPPEDKKGDQGQQSPPPNEPPKEQPPGEASEKPEPKPAAGKDEQKPVDDPAAPTPQGQGGEKEEKPEPQPIPGEKDDQAQPDEPPRGALGQPPSGKELSPEETKRLLDRLQAILLEKAELDKAQQAARPRVKKDW